MEDKKLTIGIKGKASIIADESNSASNMGSGSVSVFSTPWMVALMEEASQSSVIPFLEDGQSTVGTKLDISHDAATPIGMKVTAKSELTEVDGRRLVFKVEAFDEKEQIGKGTHERFIINTDKFINKVNSKKD